MGRIRLVALVGMAVAVMVAVGVAVAAGGSGGGDKNFTADLVGYEEVPAVSTPGFGSFEARLNKAGTAVDFTLTYANLDAAPTQSHIHFGQRSVNGGVSVFLCSSLASPPPGTQTCPATRSGTVRGTFDADDVIGPAGQGIAAREFGELIAAMRSGVSYANLHTEKFGGGEIRGQIK